MKEKKHVGKRGWVDPDDAPELTDAMFDRAEIRKGGKVVQEASPPLRGRPPIDGERKRPVQLRLAARVLEHFRASGPGWQTRINEHLEKIVDRESRKARERA